jgi:hypothetical protein
MFCNRLNGKCQLRKRLLLSLFFLPVFCMPVIAIEDIKIRAIQKVDLSGDDILQIEDQETEGFNFPYYLFIPGGIDNNKQVYMLVESNNTGTTSDDFDVHRAKALGLVESSYANRMARRLGAPLLVPVFPRPAKDDQIYTHSLDRDSLEIKEGKLYRIDLQLVSMTRHARELLRHNGFRIHDKVFMHGFSASGSFTNRFAFLHPNLIKAVASGAVNGIPTLPVKSWNGYELPFPIGIGDFEQLMGKPFDEKAYRKVRQYIYMGYFDRNDTVPSRDAWSEAEAKIIKEAIAPRMMPDRWKVSRMIYHQQKLPVQLVTYNGVAHAITNEMQDDITDFFKANAGEKFVRIKPYEYPFVEYKEIRQAHVNGLYFFDDERIPEWLRKDHHQRSFLMSIKEWHEGQDHRQLDEFRTNAGFRFVLRAEGQKDIEISEKNYGGNCSSGNGKFQAFYVNLNNAQFGQIVPGASYRLEPLNDSNEYYWTVNDGVTLRRAGRSAAFDLLNSTILPGKISFDGDIRILIPWLEHSVSKIELPDGMKKIEFVLLVEPEELGKFPNIKFSAEGLSVIEVLWIACNRTSLEYRIKGDTVYIDKKR